MASVRIRLEEVSDLPAICVCCGEPATLMRQQDFQLKSALTAAILVTSVSALDGLVWTKRGISLSLPVCEYHKRRGRTSNQTFFRGMALTIAIGVAAYIGSFFEGAAANYLAVGAMIAFIATIVAGMSEIDDGLGVKSLKDNALALTGVSKRFAEASECRKHKSADRAL